MEVAIILGVLVGVILVLAVLAAVGRFFGLWVRGLVTGARVGLFSMFFMSLRKVDPSAIVEAKIIMSQAGLTHIRTGFLEGHFLAGGHVRRVVKALVIAHRARIPLDWNTATAIDLAGRDVLQAVQMSVDPRVIDCPKPGTPGRDTLDGVAKDGIQLKVIARVTVRSNLAQLVGGATEDTVIARVGEGIVSAIGSCERHQDVLAAPEIIARRVHERGLDAQTAFEIVSIDIADVEVGTNLGARLQSDQAEADMRVARAKAEERRAAAMAREQEMIAQAEENRAAVVMAQSEVPKAMADAFREGNVYRRQGERLVLPMHR